jgi:magnesium chelatase family protein
MDRIDIHLEVPPVHFKDLAATEGGESSAEILSRVKAARRIQAERFQKMKIYTNAHMNSRQVRKFCTLDFQSGELLEQAMEKFGLSARAHSRILKIARTIADLTGSEEITSAHVAEAIQYRSLDRRGYR